MGVRVLASVLLVCLGQACASTAPSRRQPVPLGLAHREPDVVAVTHEVQPGQTLYRIARAYGLSVDQLMAANRIDDPRELRAGEALVIPGAQARRDVAAYDAPEPEPAPRPAASQVSLPAGGVTRGGRAGRVDRPTRRPQRSPPVGRGTGELQWPLRGVLYARFGQKGKEPHDGIDLAAPAGLPVRTAGVGTVLFAGEQKGYGLIVIVEHREGLITLYAHNRDLRVKTGQVLREGQVVATVGDSGRTSGPHLHFEVRKDGVPVDPLEYLGTVPSS